jgi:transcriptional regulator with XRE-family HTH domain
MKLRQINIVKTGERIQRLRKERGLTVRQITDTLGLIPQTYYKWVWGVSVPSVDSLIGLADILGVKVDDIIVAE